MKRRDILFGTFWFAVGSLVCLALVRRVGETHPVFLTLTIVLSFLLGWLFTWTVSRLLHWLVPRRASLLRYFVRYFEKHYIAWVAFLVGGGVVFVLCYHASKLSPTGKYCHVCGAPAQNSVKYTPFGQPLEGGTTLWFCKQHLASRPETITTRWEEAYGTHDLGGYGGWAIYIFEAVGLAMLGAAICWLRVSYVRWVEIGYAAMLLAAWPALWNHLLFRTVALVCGGCALGVILWLRFQAAERE